MSRIKEFTSRVNDIFRISALMSHLSWDQQTKMPEKGAQSRSEMMAWLATEHHRRLTDPTFGELIDELEKSDLNPSDLVNVDLMRREYNRSIKLSEDFVNRFTEACSKAFMIWQKAKAESNFEVFQPHLQTLIELTKEKIELLGIEDTPYDVLLDEYEVGMKVADYDLFFEEIETRLVPLFRAIRGSSLSNPKLEDTLFTEEVQKEFYEKVVKIMGFDMKAGRIDVAPHPFCSGLWPGDTRLTTRYDEKNPFSCIYAIMHEVGHGLYEQGLDLNHAFTPVGKAVSLGIHESQSRFWENQIGRSKSFFKIALPWFEDLFRTKKQIDEEEMYRLVNAVEPSFIRVEADEITYNLHIMLRYEIEKKIFNENLPTNQIEEVWNQMFEKWFGVSVPESSKGCLQDVHWAYAAFGYFPTYTLGNVYAAQISKAMSDDIGPLEEIIQGGDWSAIKDWLGDKIHSKGSLFRPSTLIQRATGEPPNPKPFLDYIEKKYSEIYNL